MFLENIKRQHEELIDMAGSIAIQLNPEKIQKDSTQIRLLLSQFAGKLKIHLATEDNYLYPSLMKRENEEVKKLVKEFTDEMGEISKIFTEYNQKWANPKKIEQNMQVFIEETRDILEALGHRVEKEEKILFKEIASI